MEYPLGKRYRHLPLCFESYVAGLNPNSFFFDEVLMAKNPRTASTFIAK
jgi:hypothetical protein